MADGNRNAKKRGIVLTTLLAVLAIEAVAMIGYDAVTANKAKTRGESPSFLFTLLPPQLAPGVERMAGMNQEDRTSRYVALAANLAVPLAAVGLPVLLFLFALIVRRRGAAWLGVLLLLAGLGGGVGLYRAVGASQEVLSLLGIEPTEKVERPRTAPAKPDAPVEAVKPEPAAEHPVTTPESEAPVTETPAPPPPAEQVAATGQPEASVATTPAPPPPPVPAIKRVEKIFFSTNRDSPDGDRPQWDLWVMNPDGKEQQKISKTMRVHMQPRLSPDGTKLAFTSADGDKRVVGVMDLATAAEQVICEGDQGAFTGDGKGLVFRRDGGMWVRDLADGQERRITPPLWKGCAYPSASPDGQSLALASRLMAGYNVYLVPLAGGTPRPLVEGRGACDPRWSPSGKQLSFQTETHIYTIKPDGSETTQVSFGGGVQHYACWSPDETSIAYCQGPGPNGPWQIYRVSLVEDEDATPLTTADQGSNMYPEWGLAPADLGRP